MCDATPQYVWRYTIAITSHSWVYLTLIRSHALHLRSYAAACTLVWCCSVCAAGKHTHCGARQLRQCDAVAFLRETWLIECCHIGMCVTWLVQCCCVRMCVTRLVRSCRIRVTHIQTQEHCGTHSHVWHDSFTCVAWLIHMCGMTHSHNNILVHVNATTTIEWVVTFTRVTRRVRCCCIHMHVVEQLLCMLLYNNSSACSCIHTYVTCVTWLIHMCDMTHSHVAAQQLFCMFMYTYICMTTVLHVSHVWLVPHVSCRIHLFGALVCGKWSATCVACHTCFTCVACPTSYSLESVT